jgi:hypothetical protein
MGRILNRKMMRAMTVEGKLTPWKITAAPRTGLNEVFITGEKIQSICDVYLTNGDSIANPYFGNEFLKFRHIRSISSSYDNPTLVFCFTHCIPDLASRLHFFQNDFVLVSHNSDHEVHNNDVSQKILGCPRLIYWFSQNVCMEHPKLSVLPIGLANTQWQHGNTTPFVKLLQNPPQKTRHVYFNFGIGTNAGKRQPCYDILSRKGGSSLEWLPHIDPVANLIRLAESEFCICPEGNGVDTHRLWEALYLRVVPIVIRTPFIESLQRQFSTAMMIPMIILESWEDLDTEALEYSMFDLLFDCFLPMINVAEIQRTIQQRAVGLPLDNA